MIVKIFLSRTNFRQGNVNALFWDGLPVTGGEGNITGEFRKYTSFDLADQELIKAKKSLWFLPCM